MFPLQGEENPFLNSTKPLGRRHMTDVKNRRDFLKQSVKYTAIAGGTLIFGGIDKLIANAATDTIPDLVAVRNGEPGVMYDKAIAAMGGIDKYVKPGQTVVLKPNIGWDRGPESGANTNPDLVKRVVESCYEADASKVYVFDNSVDPGNKCYKNSGIKAAVEEAGGIMVPASMGKYYRKVKIAGGRAFSTLKIHHLIVDSDVYFNIPVLKDHSATRLTMAMKNQMGIVSDMSNFHKIGLHYCIADVGLYRKPDLNIMDAYRVTMANGPQRARQKDLELKKSLLLSPDIVAIDSAGAKMFGLAPKKISYIKYAAKSKLGEMDLSKITIKKIYL